MMNSITTSQKGFSLLELMVAMAIASVLMAGIYTFYHNQLKTHITQQEMVDMQQDARAAMYMMTREIRMAGYDPQYNSGATIRTANDEAIAFDSDENRNGVIDTDERFYYALNNDSLVRGGWNTPSAPVPENLNPVALNIDALNFVYLDNAGSWDNLLFNLDAADEDKKSILWNGLDCVPNFCWTLNDILDAGGGRTVGPATFTLAIEDNDDLDGNDEVDTDDTIFLTSTLVSPYRNAIATIRTAVRGGGEAYAQEHYNAGSSGEAGAESETASANVRW